LLQPLGSLLHLRPGGSSWPMVVEAAAAQQPLLPETLSPGITAAAARRTRAALARFFGKEPTADEEGDEAAVLAGVCILRVTETNLVHYTKRPKPLAKVLDDSTETERGDDPPPVDEKYWKRRYNYFARFDEGVRMDAGAWFEVTPESVARHIADCLPYGLVVDGTCGVGGNAIQFAMSSQRVLAVDTDAGRLRDAEHNASVYGVRERIDFVHDDFAHFAAEYRGPPVDAVFLSPPWGGPQHLDADYFSLLDVPCPDIVKLFVAASELSTRVVLYLPRHVDLHEIAMLASAQGFSTVTVEKVFFQYPTPHLKLVVVYFTPEAVAAPLQATVKKAVGRTGGPGLQASQQGTSQGRKEAPGAGARRAEQLVPPKAAELLLLPPLAGPVIRALYCRCHYLGRYVVALSRMLERQREAAQALAAPAASQGARPGSHARRAKGPPASKRADDGGEDTKAQLHSQVARALCETLGRGSEEESLQACLAWLLDELPLAELLRLVREAAAERAEAEASLDEDSESQELGPCFFSLLRRRLPELHQKLVQWRKAVAIAQC